MPQEIDAILPAVVVYGSSGHSQAYAQMIGLEGAAPRLCRVVAYVDDVVGGTGVEVGGLPVLSFEAFRRDWLHVPCVFPIGDGGLRRGLVRRVEAAGGGSIALYAGQGGRPGVRVGVGALLSQPGYIGPNTVIGDHAQVMPMHSIGHDVVVEAFATIAPSCTVSGYVVVGEAAYVGAGVTVVNGRAGRPLVIGAGARISAGAVVTKDVPAGAAVAGNPARRLREIARRL